MIYVEDVLCELFGVMIIVDVKVLCVLFEKVLVFGGKLMMWKIGYSLIKFKMKEMGLLLVGEMSGYVFFKYEYYGFDDVFYVVIWLIVVLVCFG